MPDTEKNISRAEKIAGEYMSQIFYFALRKTSSRDEAQKTADKITPLVKSALEEMKDSPFLPENQSFD